MRKEIVLKEDFAPRVAKEIISIISETLKVKKTFSLALAGGRTPEKFYKILAEKYANAVDWTKVHFFWSDERFVPDTHIDSNVGLAMRVLLEPLKIPAENIHLMNKNLDIKTSAELYTKEVLKYSDFDLVLLGIGGDCHTASIFPRQPLIHQVGKKVEAVDYSKVNHLRLSFSPDLITSANKVIVTVTGADKITALDSIFNSVTPVDDCPAKLLFNSKDLLWFIDNEAGESFDV